MLTDLCELSPSYVRSIAPYQPGKPISELAREMGLEEKTIVKLASNENPLGIGPRTRAAIEAALAEVARYPDGNGYELKVALSKRYGVDMNAIVLGNGSNDVLELVALAFLGPGRAAVFSQHCFAVYPLATQARGARGIAVRARDYGHDLDAMANAIGNETSVAWIANPNNPTGTFCTGEQLEAFLKRVPERVIVVLDEAYNEYLPNELRADTVKWLKRYPNLVIARHLFQGLWPRGPARGLRARASLGRRHDESRAPAVQRQQHRARRGRCGARRHGVRRAQLRGESAGAAPAGRRGTRARPGLHSLLRQLPHRPRRKSAGGL
jgi:hypothetical protein